MLEGVVLVKGEIDECLREGWFSFRVGGVGGGGGGTSKGRGKEMINVANEFVCVGVALGATMKIIRLMLFYGFLRRVVFTLLIQLPRLHLHSEISPVPFLRRDITKTINKSPINSQ